MKNNLKKGIALTIAMNMMLCLVACGSSNNPENNTSVDSSEVADKIVYANFYSEEGQDVQAVAMKDGLILFAGNKEDAEQYMNKSTEVIDYTDQYAMPGFIDGHTHSYVSAENTICDFNLVNCQKAEECVAIINKYVKENPKDFYIGYGWLDSMFEGGMPTAQLLEKIDTDSPIYIKSEDCHSCWTNSAMMERCHITKDTENPIGGVVEHYKNGEPAGCFRDTAMDLLIKPNVPVYSVEQYKEILEKSMNDYIALGYTAYNDVLIDVTSADNIVEAYHELDQEGKLKAYVNATYIVNNDEKIFDNLEHIKENENLSVTPLYEVENQVVNVNYTGIDLKGLEIVNDHYGSKNYGDAEIGGGCSITFAEYEDGTTGAVRNMDLQRSEFCSYQLMIQPGDNVKYPVWALSYTGVDDKSYEQVLEQGMSADRYKALPYQTTDAMSFGKDENGKNESLYCAVLMRGDQQDENGNYMWACSGTNPGAKYRCATQSVPILLTTQYVNVEDALKAVGAVDEDYQRIYPDDEPTIDVYTFNIETEKSSNHWFEVIAMEDSTGDHGILEFIDNHAIWHDNLDYSFNYFLQDEYLKDENGKYIEDHGAGLGRYSATVPYLDRIHNISDHLSLMDGIRYSYMTYYDEENDYVGYDFYGKPVDWRSEMSGSDVFATYEGMHDLLKLNTKEADEKYPLWAYYKNTETGKKEKIDSYAYWKENKDHLQSLWTLDYVMQEENKEEVQNFIRWNGEFNNHLSKDEINETRAGWETYFKVLANPMKGKVTRWFNEDVSTADTISIADFSEK